MHFIKEKKFSPMFRNALLAAVIKCSDLPVLFYIQSQQGHDNNF